MILEALERNREQPLYHVAYGVEQPGCRQDSMAAYLHQSAYNPRHGQG